jgi:hypothetical protein
MHPHVNPIGIQLRRQRLRPAEHVDAGPGAGRHDADAETIRCHLANPY